MLSIDFKDWNSLRDFIEGKENVHIDITTHIDFLVSRAKKILRAEAEAGEIDIMKLMTRNYNYNDYKIGDNVVTVCKCLDANIYINTGYYIGLNSTVLFSEDEYKRCFKSLTSIKKYIHTSLKQRGYIDAK